MHPHDRLMLLWTTMFGPTGTNGVQGTVKSHATELSELSRRIRRFESLEGQILAILVAAKWVGLTLGTTIAFLASGPVGELIGRALLAASGR